MKKQIGWYNLKEDKIYENTFECAAWYERLLVKAGRYPAYVYDYQEVERDEGMVVDGHINGIYVTMPGTIISDEFGARFCGMPISDYDNHKNTGKPASHSMFAYMFSVAESVLKNPDTPWELLPEYEAKEMRFNSPLDGREIVSHGIYIR